MSSQQLTQRKNKHILQRTAKVVAIISIISAFISGIYLITIMEGDDKIMQSFYGAISFFCFMMGLVLQSIGNANLPDLTVPTDKEIKDQILKIERMKD